MPLSLFQKSAQKGGETKALIYQLSWYTGTCNDDSKELLNIKSIPESPIYDLADIVTGKKVLSTLSDVEKYQDLTKTIALQTNRHYSKRVYRKVERLKH